MSPELSPVAVEEDDGIHAALLRDLFESKFALHVNDECSVASSSVNEPEPGWQDSDETGEESLADLLQLINGVKLLPSSKQIKYSISGLFNAFNTHPLATGAFFQLRKLDQSHGGKQLVAKYPRLDLTNKRGGISREALRAIRLEIQALSHPPILEHPNIVDLLGFSWATLSPVDSGDRIIPVLFLEFATHGTLRGYLSDNTTTPQERLRLGKGLGEGLSVLHRSGIVHGDLKLDNVLVFAHPDGSVVPKLADFGSALQLTEYDGQFRGGTPPWTAPEWRRSTELAEQPAADVYSFGLLIWSLCLEGRDPFPGWTADEIESRKMRDVVRSDAVKSVTDFYDFYRHTIKCSTEAEQFDLYDASVIRPRKVFQSTLSFSPERRHMGMALAALTVEGFDMPRKNAASAPEDEVNVLNMLHGVKGMNAYAKLPEMPEKVRRSLFRSFTAAVEADRLSESERAQMCVQLALCHLDGFSGHFDPSTALSWLERGAVLGSGAARGILHRLSCATGKFKNAQYPILAGRTLEYLVDATVLGCRFARQDLTQLAPDAAQAAIDESRQRFYPRGVDPGIRLEKEAVEAVIDPRWQQGLSPTQRTVIQGQRHRTYLNSKRGSHLHFASAYGVALLSFEAFLDAEKPDINAKDEDGNTPLLMAMRSGYGHHALALLNRGADPAISNNSGQTPCHWAINIQNLELLEELLQAMVSKGADLEVIAARSDIHDGRIYCQDSYDGTPLLWAVVESRLDLISALLRHGASPTTADNDMSPFDVAVAYNSYQIIKILAKYAQVPISSRTVGSNQGMGTPATEDWVSLALFGFSRHYHMILHGPSHVDTLKRTLIELGRAGLVNGDLRKQLKRASQLGGIEPVDSILWYQTCKMKEFSSFDLAEIFMEGAAEISPDAAWILLDRIASKMGTQNCPLPDMTPLLFRYPVSHRADIGIFRRLLDLIKAPSVDIADDNGITSYRHITPFMLAVLGGAFDFATELLRRGADPRFKTARVTSTAPQTSSKVNILHLLILVNEDTSLAGLQYLLEPHHPYQALIPDFVICEDSGLTALIHAAHWGNKLLFDYLANHFSSPELVNMRMRECGTTALHAAALHGHYDIAMALVNRGAKVNVLERAGRGRLKSPLDLCYDTSIYKTNIPRTNRFWEDLWISRIRIANFLIGKGGRSLSKKTMPIELYFILHACSGNWPGLLRESLKLAPKELKSEEILNALLARAAKRGCEDVMGLLIDAGACVNAASTKWRTPLHMAASRGYMYAARVLIQRGADPTLRDRKGRTAAALALAYGHKGLASYLISQGSPEDPLKTMSVPFTVVLRNRLTDAVSKETLIARACILEWPRPDNWHVEPHQDVFVSGLRPKEHIDPLRLLERLINSQRDGAGFEVISSEPAARHIADPRQADLWPFYLVNALTIALFSFVHPELDRLLDPSMEEALDRSTEISFWIMQISRQLESQGLEDPAQGLEVRTHNTLPMTGRRGDGFHAAWADKGQGR